jgi:predicted alpha/beta-fold hydrolase
MSARSLRDFDDAYTSVVHGFDSAEDYYARSSSLQFLDGVRVPTLLLSARDDPFHPRELLDEVEAVAARNANLYTDFPRRGGHVGFVEGRWPWSAAYYLERRALDFLAPRLDVANARVDEPVSIT